MGAAFTIGRVAAVFYCYFLLLLFCNIFLLLVFTAHFLLVAFASGVYKRFF